MQVLIRPREVAVGGVLPAQAPEQCWVPGFARALCGARVLACPGRPFGASSRSRPGAARRRAWSGGAGGHGAASGGFPLPLTAALHGGAAAASVRLGRRRLRLVRRELEGLRATLRRQPASFTVGQYNILAGYMGNNMEPWFLYGVDMPHERRKQIINLHQERGSDGKFKHVGWPAYVQGVLSEEEQRTVERVHHEHFSWDQRKGKLIKIIRQMDADLLSLVECDHYEDYFKPRLKAMGYGLLWKKRPRNGSLDGCLVAWRSCIFELVAHTWLDYVDKFCPITGETHKDRIAIIALLRMRLTGNLVCFVSTHLRRNPEDPCEDLLRARQVGQVVRHLTAFTNKHGAQDVPVVLTGDLNCTSFGRLRGIANTVSLLSQDDPSVHPFTFDCGDVPTGVTSVTTARSMRIDAIMYQTQRLELVDVLDAPELCQKNPIPNAEHPSDHVPIVAQFRVRSRLGAMKRLAREWFLTLVGHPGQLPLSTDQLRSTFKLFDYDGAGRATYAEVRKVLLQICGCAPQDVSKVLALVPPGGLDLDGFVKIYRKALASSGLPCAEEFHDAFAILDRNGDGGLDDKEFLWFFEECAPAPVCESKLRHLFTNIDRNSDGRIDLQELVQHLSGEWVKRLTL